jgi:hypothetical protein
MKRAHTVAAAGGICHYYKLISLFPVDTKEEENSAKKSKKVVFEESAATEEKSTKVKAEQKKSKGAYLLWIKENRKVRSPHATSFRPGGRNDFLYPSFYSVVVHSTCLAQP